MNYLEDRRINAHQSTLYNLTYRTDIADLKALLGPELEQRRYERILIWRYRWPQIGTPVQVWEPIEASAEPAD